MQFFESNCQTQRTLQFNRFPFVGEIVSLQQRAIESDRAYLEVMGAQPTFRTLKQTDGAFSIELKSFVACSQNLYCIFIICISISILRLWCILYLNYIYRVIHPSRNSCCKCKSCSKAKRSSRHCPSASQICVADSGGNKIISVLFRYQM